MLLLLVMGMLVVLVVLMVLGELVLFVEGIFVISPIILGTKKY